MYLGKAPQAESLSRLPQDGPESIVEERGQSLSNDIDTCHRWSSHCTYPGFWDQQASHQCHMAHIWEIHQAHSRAQEMLQRALARNLLEILLPTMSGLKELLNLSRTASRKEQCDNDTSYQCHAHHNHQIPTS